MTDLATRIEALDATDEEVLKGVGLREISDNRPDTTWLAPDGSVYRHWDMPLPRPLTNLQDALDLMAAVLPGWSALVSTEGTAYLYAPGLLALVHDATCEGDADNPAAALSAAIVRAYEKDKA